MSAQPSSWIDLPSRTRNPVNALKEALRQLSCMIHVAMPGIVQSFNADAGTVVVQLAIRETVNQNMPDGLGNVVPVITPVAVGLLQDVPVVFIGGGGFTVCPAIAPGDECLVIFSDSCINSWWANGGVQNQEVKRRHSFSDGFAIVGLRSQPRKLTGYNTTAIEIRSDDGSTKLSMSHGNIVLTNDGGTTEITMGGSTVTIKATSIVCNGPVTFEDAVTFDGNVTVDGSMVVDGSVSAASMASSGHVTATDFVAGSIALTTHLHGGVQNGSGVTGGPFG